MAKSEGRASTPADALFVPSTSRSLRRLPRLIWGAVRLSSRSGKRELLASFALQAVGAALLAVQVIAGREMLAHLINNQKSVDFSSAIPALAALAAALGLNAIVTVLRTEVQRLLSELVSAFATGRVLEAAAAAELLRFEDPVFHDRLQRATVNASIRPLQMTNGVLTVASSALSSLGIAATLLVIQPLLLVLGALAVIPLSIVSIRIGRDLYRFAVAQTPTDRQRSYLQQLLVGKDQAKEIRAYELGEHLRLRFGALYDQRITALRHLVRRRMTQGVLGGVLTALLTGASLGVLLLLVSDHRMSLAGAGAAAAALVLLGSQLQSLAAGVGNLYESALFIEDFNSFVDLLPVLDRPTEGLPSPARVGRLSAEHLSFTYPSRTEPSLVDVDLHIEPGEIVALVGENGSGKTTLAKLLANLYKPQQGTISWDGVNLSLLDRAAARDRVAVLFQDFVRFFLAARENVTLGRFQRAEDHQAFLDAVTKSGANTFLESLPNGYETLLGPEFFGGSDLSGGQWQRVALARAFFRDAELVILDEPTSAMDPRAEAALFDSVRELFAGRSVLLISHRFATVRMADRIYVLESGRIAEHGTHDQLMAEGGLYADLFTLQAAAFGPLETPEGTHPV